MNVSNRIAATVAAATLCGAGSAAAAVPGFYLEGSAGMASSSMGQEEQDVLDDLLVEALEDEGLQVLDGDSDLDKSGVGFSLALGYRFTSYVALEAAYVQLGKSTYKAEDVITDGVEEYDLSARIPARAKGPVVSLVGIWPASESFELDARVGAFFGKSTLSVKFAVDGESVPTVSDSDSKTSILYGVGASWNFTPAMSLRLSYTMFDKGLFDEFDVGSLSLGLMYSF